MACLVDQKPPGFCIETRLTHLPWHTAMKLLQAALMQVITRVENLYLQSSLKIKFDAKSHELCCHHSP